MSEKERGNENLSKGIFDGDGQYDIPIVAPCKSIGATQFISFNYAMTEKSPKHKGVHHFLDDYQFLRTWSTPEKYVDVFRRFDCVCGPDFSLYVDYPRAVQIWNYYRNMFLCAYYQTQGINIVPVACWSDEESWQWCFDGMPRDSIIAVSNTGCVKGNYQKALFELGFYEMMERLTPKKILFFGQVPDYLKDIDIIQNIGNSHDRFAALDKE